ncbi:trp operon repressor [Endozoicomonas sp. OPT23]|uniref:trp operon repressor n=1 Tax=Endozoicomonas sp. OPT23 TaxID=2072845 RepID=UPI001E638BA5|nr:trp operon repressor [Endozoicomonas sp. OPT23]
MNVEQWLKVVDLLQEQEDVAALRRILAVLLTPEEQDAIASRLSIMRALLAGNMSQREIAADQGVSIAKVTRCSNYLKRLSEEEKMLVINQ